MEYKNSYIKEKNYLVFLFFVKFKNKIKIVEINIFYFLNFKMCSQAHKVCTCFF